MKEELDNVLECKLIDENMTNSNLQTIALNNKKFLSQNKYLSTEIDVITLDDNITHPYFDSIIWNKDNYSISAGNAVISMPYLSEVLDYWRKYNGIVIISADLKNSNNKITTITNFQERVNREKLGYEPIKYDDDAKRNANAPYNYSFIGKVVKIKTKGQKVYITLNDLGWKFSQKVPREFRDAYISGQTLGDAFQAMCEFMGIEFAYSIEDLDELEFAEDGYSVKKDGEIIEDVPSLFREWGNDEKEEDSSNLDDPANENPGLIEYTKKTNSNSIDVNENQNINISENNSQQDTQENEESENNSVRDKIEKYQAEFDEKIKNLFIGNMMYNSDLTSNVMDYGAITITPKESSSENMSGVGGATTGSNGSSSNGTPYWEKEGFSSQASYDKYQAQKNSNGYGYYIQTRDKGWQKVIYRRYLEATRKGWVTRMDKGNIKGKAHGSTMPLWKYVLKL